MLPIFRRIVINNEFENNQYTIISEKIIHNKNKHYFYAENYRSGESYKIEINPKIGTSRLLLKADFLKGHAPNMWVIAKYYNDNIVVDYCKF